MRPLLLLLILPPALALTAIYAKGFSQDCYTYRSATEELLPETPFILASFLRDSGFDVEVIEDSTGLDRFDAVIVLACTNMDGEDVNRFLEYIEGGGGLVVDVRKDNPLARALGVARKAYPLQGVKRGSLDTVYTRVVNGVLVKSPVKDERGPLVFGYERMYYVGKPIKLPKGFNSGFVTESGEDVMGWTEEGGRVAVIGCLYCADPLLLTNLVDWAEDGHVDFPRFSVDRKVVPSVVPLGGTLVDVVTVLTEKGVEQVEGAYLYGQGEPYCDLGEPVPEMEPPQVLGDRYRMEVKFIYRGMEKPGSCLLPPALIKLYWQGMERRVIVDPVRVTVASRSVVTITQWDPLLLGLALLILGAVAFVGHREMKKRWLLREWRKYRDLIEMTKRRWMRREIQEAVFRDLMKDYQESLQKIEVELRMMGVEPGRTGTEGRGLGPQEGAGRRGH